MIRLAKPSVPHFDKISKQFKEVLESGMLTNSKYVEIFENNCGSFLKNKNSIAVASGTSALLLAINVLNLKGEVIIPSFTFSSTGHSLIWNKIKPVFADINPETFNIDPKDIERKITKKTSAIIAIHCFGNPADIKSIENIAKKYNLKVIYDAAHAFGSKFQGASVAKFGNASIFSFTPTKVLTTAEGGLIVVKEKKLVSKIKAGRNNGDSFNRQEEFLGITARMNEFSAILGIANLNSLKKDLKRRLKIVEYYKRRLGKLPGIKFQKVNNNDFSSYKDFAIITTQGKKVRNSLLNKLHKNNIQAKSYFYPPLHRKKVYKKYCRNIKLPNTDWLSDRIISLPLYSSIPLKEVAKVCQAIEDFIRNK
jgi:dTDP-4-amino-4,6-dideoxygalactose transaminase